MTNTSYRVPTVPPDLRRRVDAELVTGESLIWLAQPEPRLFGRQAWPFVLFGIPWTAFSMFWIWGAIGAPGPFALFPLVGLPLVLIGLGMLVSPFWLARRATKTIYAITNLRAIVWEGRILGGTHVQSFLPERLTAMTRIERADGSGDVLFEEFTTGRGSGSTTVRRGFVGVARVREVEDVVRRTLLAGRARAAVAAAAD